MAKLFKKIANNLTGLAQVYNDSPTNDPVLANIENLASANPVDVAYVNNGMLRIVPAYNLYTGNWVPSRTQAVLTSNQLQLGTTINRKRLSDFYAWLSVNNPYIKYNANDTKAENGTLIEIRPYGKGVEDTAKMKQNSEQVPIVSGPRDEKRLFNYLKTHTGILFLALQQTLQGGNTFKQSRKYDPTSVLVSAGKRTLASVSNALERVTRAVDVDTIGSTSMKPYRAIDNMSGRLQRETVSTATDSVNIIYQGGTTGGSNRTSLLGRVGATAASRLVQDIKNRTNISVFGKKINLGQLGRTLDTYAQTIRAITRATDVTNATLKLGETAYDGLFKQGYPFIKDPRYNQLKYSERKDAYLTSAKSNIQKIKGKLHTNFFTVPYDADTDRSSLSYTEDLQNQTTDFGVSNGVSSAKYIKDPMNYASADSDVAVIAPNELDGKYGDIDFIKFKIIVPGVFGSGISFRAFLKDIKHNAKGDFEEQRYVGRPERFIVYKGMNRSVTFTLYLVAFSQKELSGMWVRANMLNKLVYPISTGAGYMTPPIIRLTLGDILNDQPGYVTDINMNLEGMPWDIDEEVTNVIEFNVTYNIIEKNYITQDYTNIFNKENSGFLFAEQLTSDSSANNVNTAAQIASNINVSVPSIPNPLAPIEQTTNNAINNASGTDQFRNPTFSQPSPYTDGFTTIELPQFG